MELALDGAGLAGVLTRLQDRERERFEALNEELARWLPEFDRVLFDLDNNKHRVFLLRTRQGHHAIPALDLSQGTLLALAILTLAYLPNPPSLVGLEEPDRGVHPYLLRHVQDAIYRLCHPESCGEKRDPVQVIATTHSPCFIDLFKDHPDEIVVANKVGADVQFQRLTDVPHFGEMLGEATLGEAWYTGFLGGVPSEP
jgi:predicted ATPase